MEVFIIAAMSVDGFIGQHPSQRSTQWTSKADLDFFIHKTKKAGVVVFGNTTYQTIGKPLKDRLNIVYSRHLRHGYKQDKTELRYTQSAPQELIKSLAQEGYSDVAICGGSGVNTLFFEAGVVDKLYLTIEPVIFGQGVSLLTANYLQPLTLLHSQALGKQGSWLFEYQVHR